jgi:hypothetical protein
MVAVGDVYRCINASTGEPYVNPDAKGMYWIVMTETKLALFSLDRMNCPINMHDLDRVDPRELTVKVEDPEQLAFIFAWFVNTLERKKLLALENLELATKKLILANQAVAHVTKSQLEVEGLEQ